MPSVVEASVYKSGAIEDEATEDVTRVISNLGL